MLHNTTYIQNPPFFPLIPIKPLINDHTTRKSPNEFTHNYDPTLKFIFPRKKELNKKYFF